MKGVREYLINIWRGLPLKAFCFLLLFFFLLGPYHNVVIQICDWFLLLALRCESDSAVPATVFP